MTTFACGRGGRAPEPDISIGDTVARKSNRAITGEVNYLSGDGKRARVLWASRVSGRQRPTSTSIAVSSLVKVEATQ